MRALLTLCLLSLFLVCGCYSSVNKKPDRETSMLALNDFVKFLGAYLAYTDIYNRPPDSIDDLKDFCSDPNFPCHDIDWNSFTWQAMENGKVKIEYNEQDFSVPIVAEKGILTTDDCDTLEKCLRDELYKRMKIGDN